MTDVAELIRSIASLLWPSLCFVALLIFRADIAKALARLKRASVLGHEFELQPQLEQLREAAGQASEEVADLPENSQQIDENETLAEARAERDDPVNAILETAARSPRAALLLLAAEIEKKGREVMASVGKLTGKRLVPFRRVIEALDSHYGLPTHIPSSLKLFQEIRNKIVHGGIAEDRDILSALDSGVSIYRALEALPRERHWVDRTDVPLYSDPECTHEIVGVRGVILRTESDSGLRSSYRIFPSTRKDFKSGKRVSWEWNLRNAWPRTWYRDPDSDKIIKAWDSAGEFIGRHFEEL
ncbi:MAG: hypothetical protein F4Y41_04695 [Gammaproteobacteria bacterium]|nr:hypothetical protein [Gammaproteobacteria bacterium]MYI22318.1 hypothetical protein [Gammaproteobacteria bacterium]